MNDGRCRGKFGGLVSLRYGHYVGLSAETLIVLGGKRVSSTADAAMLSYLHRAQVL